MLVQIGTNGIKPKKRYFQNTNLFLAGLVPCMTTSNTYPKMFIEMLRNTPSMRMNRLKTALNIMITQVMMDAVMEYSIQRYGFRFRLKTER